MIKWRHDAWMVDQIETCSCNQKLPFQVPTSHNLRSLSALACIFGVAAPYVCCFIGIDGHGSRITMMEAPQQWQLLKSLIFSCRPRTTSLQECESWCQRGQHIIAQPNKNGLVGHAFKNHHNQPSWKAQDSSKWPRRAANPASRPVLLNLDFLIDSNQEFKIISVRWRKESLGLCQKTFV